MKIRQLHTPDLADFIANHGLNEILTDSCKVRILDQFLNRFRMEYDTDLEFQEVLEATIQIFKLQH